MNLKILMAVVLVMACGLAAWGVSSAQKAKKGEVILGTVQVLVSSR